MDEIYAIAKQQLDDEGARDGVLTTKANTVLGASGLSLTVAFTFGGFVLQHRETIVVGFGLVVFGFGLAMVLGLLASYFALKGLRIGRFEYVNETSILDQDNLRDANDAYDSAWRESKGDPARADRAAVTLYRRFLTAHLWGIYQRTFEKLEAKAETVKWAQRFYVGFLGAIMLIGVSLMASIGLGSRASNAAAGSGGSHFDGSSGSVDSTARQPTVTGIGSSTSSFAATTPSDGSRD